MRPLSRREFLCLARNTVLAAAVPSFFLRPDKSSSQEIKKGPSRIYIPETGHHLEGAFLRFWQRERTLVGNPITEPVYGGYFDKNRTDDGAIQFFERAAVRTMTVDGETVISPAPIGKWLFEADLSWKEFKVEGALPLNNEFFIKHGGEAFFGRPLTGVVRSDAEQVNYQVFENFVVMERDDEVTPVESGLETAFAEYVKKYKYYRFPWLKKPERTRILWPEQIVVLSVGGIVAEVLGLSTAPVSQEAGVPAYSKDLAKRSMIIGLTEQRLRAFEGDALILEAMVSTGKSGFETSFGRHRILNKYLNLIFVSPYPNDPYRLRSPYVLPFTSSQSLHGAPWNNDLGKRPKSHGCVNMNIDDVAMLYHWAEIGDPVRVAWRF